MSISGLTITLVASERARDSVAALRARPEIEVGVQRGRRLAVTTDTMSRERDRRLWDWINALPGVEHVDVVFVAFEEDAS